MCFSVYRGPWNYLKLRGGFLYSESFRITTLMISISFSSLQWCLVLRFDKKNGMKNTLFGKGKYIERATRSITADKGTHRETNFRETE
jgi:hypothetical protein